MMEWLGFFFFLGRIVTKRFWILRYAIFFGQFFAALSRGCIERCRGRCLRVNFFFLYYYLPLVDLAYLKDEGQVLPLVYNNNDT